MTQFELDAMLANAQSMQEVGFPIIRIPASQLIELIQECQEHRERMMAR